MNWISLSKCAPPTDKNVLVYGLARTSSDIFIAKRQVDINGVEYWEQSGTNNIFISVSHWQYLPKEPTK